MVEEETEEDSALREIAQAEAERQRKHRESAWKILSAYCHLQVFFGTSYVLSEQRDVVRNYVGILPPEELTAVVSFAASCSLTVVKNTALSLYDGTCKFKEMKKEWQGSLEMFGAFVVTMTVLSYFPLVDEMVMLWLSLLSAFLVMIVKHSVVERCHPKRSDEQVLLDRLSSHNEESPPKLCDVIIKQGKGMACLLVPMVGTITVIILLGGSPVMGAILPPVVAASGVGFHHYFYGEELLEEETSGSIDVTANERQYISQEFPWWDCMCCWSMGRESNYLRPRGHTYYNLWATFRGNAGDSDRENVGGLVGDLVGDELETPYASLDDGFS